MTASGKPLVSILIVDDNPRSVELLATSLAHEDVRVLTATDPEQALDLAYEHHPQIVITDLVMPKLTGMEVLERIIEFDPAIDVVLMTAHYSTESAVEAIKSWKFKPATLNGKPVTVYYNLTVNFKLQ